MTETQLAVICSDIARMMIIYGAEIYRVEDTIARICAAYDHKEAEIYATPANFIITLKNKDGIPVTDSKSITGRSPNLDRVGAINDMSRFICARKPPAEIIRLHMERINSRPVYSSRTVYISYAVAAGAFTLFFGGTFPHALIGALLGVMINFIQHRLLAVRASTFLNAAVCSLAVSFVAVTLYRMGLIVTFDKIIIGASMTLVPGLAMTNCMRDFITGDFLSGIYTLTEALLTAAGMAIGAGSAVAAVVHF